MYRPALRSPDVPRLSAETPGDRIPEIWMSISRYENRSTAVCDEGTYIYGCVLNQQAFGSVTTDEVWVRPAFICVKPSGDDLNRLVRSRKHETFAFIL
jgi:hypothetical protein